MVSFMGPGLCSGFGVMGLCSAGLALWVWHCGFGIVGSGGVQVQDLEKETS
jgi:hypothetical protein